MRSKAAKFRFGALVVLAALVLLSSCTSEVEFSVPVPRQWQMESESGRISRLCFGSGDECGRVFRVYRTSVSAEKGLIQFRRAIRLTRWKMTDVETRPDGNISARAETKRGDRIAQVVLQDSQASIKFLTSGAVES